MAIHTCTRCPLRFLNQAELLDHMEHDHRAAMDASAYPGVTESRPLYRTFSADDGVHRVLLVANQTLGPAAVQAVLSSRPTSAGKPDAELSVFVLVPATPSDHLGVAPGLDGVATARRGLQARTDDAGMAQARWRLRRSIELLTDAGIVCHGRLGDPDPLTAVAQVLAEEPIDEIILCTLATTMSRWLRADVPTQFRRRFDIPLTVVTDPGANARPTSWSLDLTDRPRSSDDLDDPMTQMPRVR